VPMTSGFQLVVGTAFDHGNSARQWSADKKRLRFCQLTQDGDDEGCLTLDRLPTEAEGDIIRDVMGIGKARHLTEEQHARLVAIGTKGRFQAKFSGKAGAEVE
jgi:hypothetical protein